MYKKIQQLKANLAGRKLSQRGFTLLIAALIASIVLSLASAIFDIAQKQIALASLSQQSQYAFYAADTAAECGLYWDIRYNYFATTTPSGAALPYSPTCDSQSIALTTPLSNQSYPYTVTTPKLPAINLFSGKYCVQLTVTKTLDNSTNPPTVRTVVHADGFNTSCANIAVSPTSLERSVELNY
jgi:hypothetical protein